MQLFNRDNKKKQKLDEVPEIMQPENPVNYNSVLDYLVGLSKAEYSKMIKSADIYREANAKVAKVIGVKDEPTTTIKSEAPTDDEVDEQLDTLLEADPDFIDEASDPATPEITKPQASTKKVEIE